MDAKWDTLMTEAVRAHETGDVAAALPLYRRLLAMRPNDVDALRLFAVAAARAGRHAEAVTAAERAVALAPDYAVAWSNLGTVLDEADRTAEALAAFRRACALEPEGAVHWHNLGNALGADNAAADALEAYRRALALQPDHAGARIGLGHMLKTLGDGAGAAAAYRAVVADAPGAGQVWWSLANLKTYRFAPEEEAAMTAALAEELPPAQRAALLFARAKARDDAGDFDAAFALYDEANALQRGEVRYDPLQTELLNDRIVATFDPDFFANRTGWGHDDPAPIFIVGLPRSGSTLIEQILASHPQVDGTAELPDLGRLAASVGRFRSDGIAYPEAVPDLEPADAAALGRGYLARTKRHRGTAPRFTDKMPNNFPTIGFAHLILPNARFIDARRHPLDACVGCYRQLFARGQTFSYDLFELGEYYRQYDRMMRHWQGVLPGRVLRVDHERLVADQERETRRMLEFCGLEWDDACRDFHKTERAVNSASSEQVRRPINAEGIGRWRRYERHLGDLRAQLAEVIAAYEADL